jgi:hypothetical protein
MAWLSKRKLAYKIVAYDYGSQTLPGLRTVSPCKGRKYGTVLKYKIGSVVTSTNGLCLCAVPTCRGIHAWRTYAQACTNARGCDRILLVRAERWWQSAQEHDQVRALSVTVIREIQW